ASKRVRATDTPCIVQMQQMLRGREGVLSLAQGIVHWPPPEAALAAGVAAMGERSTSLYGPDDGLPELRAALKEKLRVENGIDGGEVMVTAGANQAYTNVVLSLLDAGDAAALFRPYYFNHLMALQMTGSQLDLWLPPSLPDLQPDIGALRAELEARARGDRPPLRMLTLVNPGNATGASRLCASHGVWLVADSRQEHFSARVMSGSCPARVLQCVSGEHVINVFSFSKAFGMMGWRVGYVSFPAALAPEMLKVQDTIAICPSIASQ
ncbi:hypothetical protein EMIHUDRAFT_53483, partial [Emiliania huxleyi CCMP1516]|uniref:Aminotransferase class I/classII large domain-containing protein n=2 Tax=Emiliania huxleyi TaxID=2903 RepID=A0A0D3L0H0_EMIH1